MARTDNLTNFLTDVATAIKNKKGTSEAIPASNFDTEIDSITTGEPIAVPYAPRHILFREYTGSDLDEEIANLDTSNMTSMKSMFRDCYSLEHLDLSNFNTSNISNMSYMFYYCERLTSINLSNFDASNTNDMSYMFYYCRKLTSINLSNFNASNISNMSYMFYYCERLTSIDLSGFDTSNVIDMSYMFYFCRKLNTVIIDNSNVFKLTNINVFDSTPIASGTGYVYVPDNLVDAYKNATNWSVYANQIKGISELPA